MSQVKSRIVNGIKKLKKKSKEDYNRRVKKEIDNLEKSLGKRIIGKISQKVRKIVKK